MRTYRDINGQYSVVVALVNTLTCLISGNSDEHDGLTCVADALGLILRLHAQAAAVAKICESACGSSD